MAEENMEKLIGWLLKGDVSIQYLTKFLLLDTDPEDLAPLQARIETEGYGAKFLGKRHPSGHWGNWYYQPKWTCTHYTLDDLKQIGMPAYSNDCREMIVRAFDECMVDSGGINFAKTMVHCDVAVNGMVLNYASYFCADEERIENLAGYILSTSKSDGGYSWDEHSDISDPHTTICVLEGYHEYKKAGFKDSLDNIEKSEAKAVEWLLSNGLFMSGDRRYTKLSYPYRYRFDTLRVLEYFSKEKIPYDHRMEPAFVWLKKKQHAEGFWHLENIHKGNMHFPLEEKGKPSRFITLKALFIEKVYEELLHQCCK